MSRFRTRELEKSGGHGENSSGLGTVRSKISSMASAGTLQPIVERGLRRLQHPSAATAGASSTRSGTSARGAGVHFVDCRYVAEFGDLDA